MSATGRPRLLVSFVSLSSVALLALSGCTSAAPVPDRATTTQGPVGTGQPEGDSKVRITFVGTNDLHGWLEPHARKSGGEPVLGGADTFGGYLNILRAKRPGGVVLLDAGDMFQGTLVVNMTEGEAVIKAYNLLDYDAATIGNHEFDYGPEGDPVVALTDAEDPLGNIKKRISQARFPFLAGNIFQKADGQPVKWENTRRTHLVERNGVRIGIIGLTTPLTPLVTLAQNVQSLSFGPLEEATAELAAELRGRGAQIVALVLHAGTGCQSDDDPHDTSSCDANGELYKLLHGLPAHTVDVAIAGHTHQRLSHFVNGTPAIQSGSFGRYFGVVELVYDRSADALVRDETKIWKPVPVCRQVFAATGDCREEVEGPLAPAVFLGERVVPDETIADALRPDFRMVAALKNEALGPVLTAAFGISRTDESALGALVTDFMRDTVPGADVAITNSGGIRTPLGTGPLTYGNLFQALPFDNRLAVLDLTGAELLALLRQGVEGKHGIVQLSGARIDVAQIPPNSPSCVPGGGRLVDARLADGSAIEPGRRYRVVTNDFLAGGGDGYGKVLGKVEPHRIVIRMDLPPLRELVAAQLRLRPSLKGPPANAERRIRWVPDPCPVTASPQP